MTYHSLKLNESINKDSAFSLVPLTFDNLWSDVSMSWWLTDCSTKFPVWRVVEFSCFVSLNLFTSEDVFQLRASFCIFHTFRLPSNALLERVFIGDEVHLQAEVTTGRNLTFEWHLIGPSSGINGGGTPSRSYGAPRRNCDRLVCLTDNRVGLSNSTVEVGVNCWDKYNFIIYTANSVSPVSTNFLFFFSVIQIRYEWTLFSHRHCLQPSWGYHGNHISGMYIQNRCFSSHAT